LDVPIKVTAIRIWAQDCLYQGIHNTNLNLVFANHQEEDKIYPLTTIEIAKAQKKDQEQKIYYKKHVKTPKKECLFSTY
jgi:hypothetical protein